MPRTYLSCAILLLAAAGGGLAQRPNGRPGGPMIRTGPAARPAPPAIERWYRMSPEQRERALEKLPPERQQKIRERLEKFAALSERDRQRLRERYAMFAQLSPDKQELVRRQIRSFEQAPPERRQVLAREFEQLRALADADRRARLSSDEFRGKYTSQEQQILQDLSENLAVRH